MVGNCHVTGRGGGWDETGKTKSGKKLVGKAKSKDFIFIQLCKKTNILHILL